MKLADKWFVDKGKVPTGKTVFGTDARVQVVNDEARAEGGYRARNAWRRNAWKDREKANRVAQQVRRAAALTAELAAQ